jgi:hypothetical protein
LRGVDQIKDGLMRSLRVLRRLGGYVVVLGNFDNAVLLHVLRVGVHGSLYAKHHRETPVRWRAAYAATLRRFPQSCMLHHRRVPFLLES